MKTTFRIIIFFLVSSMSSFAQQKIAASKILQDIKEGKSIVYENATITGVLDFTYMEEAMKKLPKKKKYSWWNSGNGTNEINKIIDVKIAFKNCTFKDDVLAYIPDEDSGYTFTASFDDEVAFINCNFEEKAFFKYSKFEKNADFSSSKFYGDTTFKYAKFEEEGNFETTFFKEIATFKYTKFSRNTLFSNSIFENEADFKYAKFKDGVSFKNTDFKESLNIKYMEVSGNFEISNMKVSNDIEANYTKINGKSFQKYLIKNN